VTRRLVDGERNMIASGSVFVFNEDESGIKRWTDGFFWSPSRILGNFLLYRETDKKGAGHGRRRKGGVVVEEGEEGGGGGESLSRPRNETKLSVDRHRERTLVGSLTNSYKFKTDGLMKKTFSLTIAGVAQHLISYYKVSDVESGRLRAPSTLPELASLDISPTLLEHGNFRCPPKLEVGIDGVPRYRGEADEVLAAGLDLGLGVGAPAAGGRRLGPVGGDAGARRARSAALVRGREREGVDDDDEGEDRDSDGDGGETEDGDGDEDAEGDVEMRGRRVGREVVLGKAAPVCLPAIYFRFRFQHRLC
ncbi:Gti1/Pac2 family-domain-containing protein, partial [Mycena haematopus]